MKTRDQELWACALWLEKNHGANSPAYISEQVTRLALEGDEAGIATWLAIADRFDQLAASPSPDLKNRKN